MTDNNFTDPILTFQGLVGRIGRASQAEMSNLRPGYDRPVGNEYIFIPTWSLRSDNPPDQFDLDTGDIENFGQKVVAVVTRAPGFETYEFRSKHSVLRIKTLKQLNNEIYEILKKYLPVQPT